MLAILSLVVLSLFFLPGHLFAQSSDSGPVVTVPRVIQVSGAFQPADGQAPSAVEVVTVSIYGGPDGGLPVWQERQSVAVEKTSGRFTLLLGASYPAGIPVEVFDAGQAQWMSLLFERAGEVEQPRVRITSVPYALKASDAETLGGLPAAAYLRAPTAGGGTTSGAETAAVTAGSSADVVQLGTTNFLAKYVNSADVGNSAVYESGGAVGIGTTAPADRLHIAFNDPNGFFTGLAVQNTSAGAAAFSGMLFYDQTGALGQFQGFNNSTHEYRINNVARVSPGGAFNGSINFMTGSTSRFFVGSTGNIGIGTTSPASNLEISNAIPATAAATVTATTYSDSSVNAAFFIGRRARGTAAAPTAVLGGDQLAFFGGRGHSGAGPSFGNNPSGMRVVASETWTNAAQGTSLQFTTTSQGATASILRMTLDSSGRLGIGTFAPAAVVEAFRDGDSADFRAISYGGGGNGDAGYMTRTARGTAIAPSATQLGDNLGYFFASGRGTTSFGEGGAGMLALAAENWTDTAQGSALAFITTPLGVNDPNAASLVVMPTGNVAIGTFTDIPTVADKLEVSGDIRVGTTGTNGCLKNFAGTGIAGTCSSDRRLKRDITPFAPSLRALTTLQPVHYFWRAADFPQQRFGDSRAYGLIAQDVEQVLPELVVTGEDGFKAVDYSKLPLLTIQAVKELKGENDQLKAANDELKQRIADLERRFSEIVMR